MGEALDEKQIGKRDHETRRDAEADGICVEDERLSPDLQCRQLQQAPHEAHAEQEHAPRTILAGIALENDVDGAAENQAQQREPDSTGELIQCRCAGKMYVGI